MPFKTFRNRDDAAKQLAPKLGELELRDPLVLGIPRGGVIMAATLARELDADMDVALARKLKHPLQPELAIGAVAEDGQVYLNPDVAGTVDESYVNEERRRRFAELRECRDAFRSIHPAASIEGRTVIVTDDGVATGSTMFAALRVVRAQKPHELIVAVPVAPPSTLEELRAKCDRVACLMSPEWFFAIGEFYDEFLPVEDEEVAALLREFAHAKQAH
jgi:predicted phosphoribosyltransferase